MRELEQASDEELQTLLTLLRLTRANQFSPSVVHPSLQTGDAESRKHYPLRGLPLIIAEDFDAPMPDLWDALET